jgi:hypothetical protein
MENRAQNLIVAQVESREKVKVSNIGGKTAFESIFVKIDFLQIRQIVQFFRDIKI